MPKRYARHFGGRRLYRITCLSGRAAGRRKPSIAPAALRLLMIFITWHGRRATSAPPPQAYSSVTATTYAPFARYLLETSRRAIYSGSRAMMMILAITFRLPIWRAWYRFQLALISAGEHAHASHLEPAQSLPGSPVCRYGRSSNITQPRFPRRQRAAAAFSMIMAPVIMMSRWWLADGSVSAATAFQETKKGAYSHFLGQGFRCTRWFQTAYRAFARWQAIHLMLVIVGSPHYRQCRRRLFPRWGLWRAKVDYFDYSAFSLKMMTITTE